MEMMIYDVPPVLPVAIDIKSLWDLPIEHSNMRVITTAKRLNTHSHR